MWGILRFRGLVCFLFFLMDAITDGEINSSFRLYAFVILSMFFDPKTRQMLTFHLCLEPIASWGVDFCISRSSASLLNGHGEGAWAWLPPDLWGHCLQGGKSLLLRMCWSQNGTFWVRQASGRSRRSFGKCQQWQEWGRTWWASRLAPKWRRVARGKE